MSVAVGVAVLLAVTVGGLVFDRLAGPALGAWGHRVGTRWGTRVGEWLDKL